MREQNLKTVQYIYERVQAGDLEALRPLFKDFAVIEAAGLPYGGTYRGFEGFLQMTAGFTSTWEGYSFVIDNTLADDAQVVVLLTVQGRIRGQLVKMSVIEVWQFENGRLTTLWPYYFDTKQVADLAAAGAKK